MRAELEALEAALVTLGRTVYLLHVPDDEAPPDAYYLVELAGGTRPADLPVSDATQAWDLTVRVKAVGETLAQVLTHLGAARDLLVPRGRVGALVVPGRGVTLVFARHETDYVDQDVPPHMCVSPDTYTLSSVPA